MANVKFFASDLWTAAVVLLVFTSYAIFIRRPPGPRAPSGGRPGARRILMMSYYSPPYRSALGTQRLAKFIKYFGRFGMKVSLITTVPERADERDDEGDHLPIETEIVRLSWNTLWSPAARDWVIPDGHIRWVMPAVSAAKRMLAREEYDCIVVTVPPYSNAIAGAIASAATGVPLVTDFRDPWSKIDAGWVIGNPVLRTLNARLESRILTASRRVVMVSDTRYIDDYFVTTTPETKRKIVRVSNGYDEEDFVDLPRHPDQGSRHFAISYVGSLYSDETLLSVITPLEIWRANFPSDFVDVTFEYAGQSSRLFDRLGLRTPYLRDHGFLSHRDSIELRCCSALQMFAQPLTFGPHVMSGKVFEMIRARVPIVAVVRPNGGVAHLLEETRTGFVASHENPAETAELLRSLFLRWKAGEPLTDPDMGAIRRYSREALAREMVSVLDAAVSG